MQAFLEYVVKGLVQNPDDVTITPVEREGTTVYELRLHPQDVGKIIGRQGMTINAIRSLRSEEHTSELQSRFDLVCRLLLEKKKHHKAHRSYRPLPSRHLSRHVLRLQL